MFGSEDVDLRKLTQGLSVIHSIDTNTDWTNIITIDPSTTQPSTSAIKKSPTKLDSIRAKLAKVSNDTKTRDIDLRSNGIYDENSQEMDAKLKLIMSQAKEQVENDKMNPEQFKSFVNQLSQIRTDSDMRRNKRNNQNNKLSKLDDSEQFSSGSDDQNLCQSHRVPTKRRRGSPPINRQNIGNTGNSNDKNNIGTKERRVRKTKWSPWEEPKNQQTNVIQPTVVPSTPIQTMPTPFMKPFDIWQQTPVPFNGQTTNMMNMPLQQQPIHPGLNIVMAEHGSSKGPTFGLERTINIDKVPREIRFYDENAIAFMKDNGCEPKEIGFQSGERIVTVDGKYTIVLAFNDTYKTFIIDDKSYQVRFGSPTRELYIDNEWYECYFGDPSVGIMLDGKMHVFKIDGPPPQVRIGNLRTDLVVGKVDMYINNGHTKISLFLDGQVQMFQINRQNHTIQFADYFLTVLIDNIPFAIEYGKYPVKFQLSNAEYYIRFSVLPNDVIPGKVFVRNMIRTHLQRDLISPPPIIVADIVPPVNKTILSTTNSNLLPYHFSDQTKLSIPPPQQPPPTLPPTLNINDLFQKLQETGILPKSIEAVASTSAIPAIKEKEKPTPISLSKPETLKKRQSAIVHTLFSGMQCSSCGVRFPPEQTIKYSQHLDWHYRKNRRERDSARKAHSRKWYYDVSDWIQFEEIENLEEREKNWFETQQTEMESTNDESNQRSRSPIPSCVAGPDDHDKECDMCHDRFETFYNEETEEWHLRNAIRVDGGTYHPICYEDYKVIFYN